MSDLRKKMNTTANGSNSTDFEFGAGSITFETLLLGLILVPVIVTNILILITLVCESKVNAVIRLMVANIPIACIIESMGLVILHLTALVLGINKISHPPVFLCSFSFFLISLGTIGRITYMAAFSVTVYLLIRVGKNRLHCKYFVPAVISLWTYIGIMGGMNLIQALIPAEYSFGFFCTLEGTMSIQSIILALLFLLAFLLPLLLTIIFIVIVYCFLKQHLVTDNMSLEKSMTKFAVFLIVGNTVNILTNVTAITTLTISLAVSGKHHLEDLNNDLAFGILYTNAVLTHLALIPSCLLIINYFKPLRERLKTHIGRLLKLSHIECEKKQESTMDVYIQQKSD